MIRRYVLSSTLGVFTLYTFLLLVGVLHNPKWDATTAATLFAGFVAADIVFWQGYLIKRQLAFSTYLELDKEWNSDEMIAARQRVHAPKSEEWDHSRLEGILEFFEKLASMFQVSGEIPFIYQSTLGWYAAHYFLFAREHGQIEYLRGPKMWNDKVYTDIESFYAFYVRREGGRSQKRQRQWELKRIATESKFWEQERRD